MMRERPSPWWRPQPLRVRRAKGPGCRVRAMGHVWGPLSRVRWPAGSGGGPRALQVSPAPVPISSWQWRGTPGSASGPCTCAHRPLSTAPLLSGWQSPRGPAASRVCPKGCVWLASKAGSRHTPLLWACLGGGGCTLGALVSGWPRPPADSVLMGCRSALWLRGIEVYLRKGGGRT